MPIERVFSRCALITTRNRNELSADSISSTMFLKRAWGKRQEMGLLGAVEGLFSDEEEVVSGQFNVNQRVDLLFASTCFFLMLYMYSSALGTGVPRS